jgi:hypothetical protein
VERAAGKVTVLEATCYPEPRLTITVDATLGGQSGPPRVRVAGGLASVG